MGFEQALLKVEKPEEFEELRGSIERVFAADRVEAFLKRLDRQGLRIRDFDGVFAARMLESADAELAKSGHSALALYGDLPVGDQAQVREFYLTKLESVGDALRHRFKKLYRYS